VKQRLVPRQAVDADVEEAAERGSQLQVEHPHRLAQPLPAAKRAVVRHVVTAHAGAHEHLGGGAAELRVRVGGGGAQMFWVGASGDVVDVLEPDAVRRMPVRDVGR